MSHIFGIAHSFSGIVDQVTGLFGGGNPQQTYPYNPYGYGPVIPGGGGGVVDGEFGTGTGMVPYTGGACGTTCGPKTKRFITTVCADGTTTTREAKSRKRRRRLATVSDIKDLASLKTVLGGGKAFDSWIATRGR